MGISVTHITQTGLNNVSSQVTPSLDMSANTLVVVGVWNEVSSGTADLPTVTSASRTFTQIATQLSPDSLGRITFFRSMDSSAHSEALTIDCTNTQVYIRNEVHEFVGVDTGGTNGADAIVQSGSNALSGTQSSLTVTLSAFADAANAAWGFAAKSDNNAFTAGSGFTVIASDSGPQLMSEWKLNDPTVDWTWTSESVQVIGMATEIKAKEAGGATILYNFI